MKRSNAPGSRRWTATARFSSGLSMARAASPPVQEFFMLLTTRLPPLAFARFATPALYRAYCSESAFPRYFADDQTSIVGVLCALDLRGGGGPVEKGLCPRHRDEVARGGRRRQRLDRRSSNAAGHSAANDRLA